MDQTIRQVFLMLSLTTLAAGCEPPPTQPDGSSGSAEVGAGMVASLELAAGTRLEFFEGLPGSIAVIEVGRYPQRPALDGRQQIEPLTLYRALAPAGQAPPAALLAASERRARLLGQAALAAGASEIPDALGPGGGTADPAGGLASTDGDDLCPGELFDADFFGCGRGFNAGWRECGRWMHANSSFGKHDIENAHLGACSYRGTVRHLFRWRRFFQWSLPLTTPLNPGQWARIEKNRDAFDFDIRSDVLDAEPGDGFHHGGWGVDD